MIKAITYFNFENTSEAVEFYEENFGAEIITRTMGSDAMFEEILETYNVTEKEAEKLVMNVEFTILGKTFLASDFINKKTTNNENVNVCFTFDGDNDTERERVQEFYYKALEGGCEEIVALGEQEWSDFYGVLKDPYGITWIVTAVYEEMT